MLLAAGALNAQLPRPDSVKTADGPLLVQPVNHGCLVLQWKGKTIYVDPYGGRQIFAGMPAADLILITDIHQDHLDTATLLGVVGKDPLIVAPQAVADVIAGKIRSEIRVLPNGQSTVFGNIDIVAIPMYNLPEEAGSRHPRGRGNGYVLHIGERYVYISGDTEDIPEMRGLRNIDVAFVCMNEPYTMSVEQAASAVISFSPRIVYPYHYRGQDGLSDVEKFKKLVTEGVSTTEVRLRDWYSIKK